MLNEFSTAFHTVVQRPELQRTLLKYFVLFVSVFLLLYLRDRPTFPFLLFLSFILSFPFHSFSFPFHSLTFPFLSFPFLSFPLPMSSFLSRPDLSFPFL